MDKMMCNVAEMMRTNWDGWVKLMFGEEHGAICKDCRDVLAAFFEASDRLKAYISKKAEFNIEARKN